MTIIDDRTFAMAFCSTLMRMCEIDVLDRYTCQTLHFTQIPMEDLVYEVNGLDHYGDEIIFTMTSSDGWGGLVYSCKFNETGATCVSPEDDDLKIVDPDDVKVIGNRAYFLQEDWDHSDVMVLSNIENFSTAIPSVAFEGEDWITSMYVCPDN